MKKIRNALETLAPGAQVKPSPSSTVAVAATATPTPPAIPTKQEPFTKPTFSSEEVAQYKQLHEKIDALEQERVEEFLAAAQQRLHHGKTQLAQAEKQIKTDTEAKEQADTALEKLDGWYLGKIVIGEKKRNDKVDDATKAADQAAANLASSQKRRSAAEEEIAGAQKEVNTYTVKVQELYSARNAISALVDRVFSDPGWAHDPTLLPLRTAIADLDRQIMEASTHASTYNKAKGLLQTAQGKIDQAMDALGRTRMMGMFQMGRNIVSPMRRPRGSLMMDMAELMMVEQANELVKSAAADFNTARQVLPALPFHNAAEVSAARAGVFVSMLAPGFMGSMAQQAMIQKSMMTVKELRAGVVECLQWTSKNLDAFTMDISRFRAAADGKRGEVVNYQYAEFSHAAGV